MNDRLKSIRKAKGMSQAEFGKQLGVMDSTVSRWESGDREIPDSAILSICREFGVNEVWLRTGYGEMFRPRSAEAELAELIRSRLLDAPDTFQAALVRMLLRLEPNGPELRRLREFVESLADETKKDPEP